MGLAEIIAYRVRPAAHAKLEQRGVDLARPDEPQDRFDKAWHAMQPGVQHAENYIDGFFGGLRFRSSWLKNLFTVAEHDANDSVRKD